MANDLRKIPSVSKCLGDPRMVDLQEQYGTTTVTTVLRDVLEDLRGKMQNGGRNLTPELSAIVSQCAYRITRSAESKGRRAINASGIILHTGLGRAPLSTDAIKAISEMDHFSLLEVDIESGERGRRDEKVEWIVNQLTGSEAATVVNNNAAATLLILKSLAKGKEIIISRGQLIEIGGSFRLPEIMAESGAILREVGATNKTHLADYENAISGNTGAILHVHPSNYRIHGFASSPNIEELAKLGKKHGLPVIDDLGSGALVKLDKYHIYDEPLVSDSIKAGADLVCFSGDKLICGPQAGIICGKKEFVEQIRKDPFYRMFRVDKLCLAALESTLMIFLEGEKNLNKLPLYQMLGASIEELLERANKITAKLQISKDFDFSILDDNAYAGAGASPDKAVPSKVIKIKHKKISAKDLAHDLRTGFPSVITRVHDGALYLDMRTLLCGDDEQLIQALQRVLF